jgi:hypothetical protein
MPVAVGDRALTGGGARVTLRFEGGVAVTAGPETDMEVVAHAPSSFGWRGELRIRRGAVRIEIPPGAPVDRFTVVTPTAHVSTRQAHAVVETTPLLTSVFADTGRVLVSGVEGPDEAVTVLGPGFGVDVMRRQSAYDPLRWDPSRIQALMQRTSYP